ncbi:MAG: ribbon-helix-helix protein, CopG family [Solirubrobacterales bacterium]|nr:ribbon-helix-helix protein, CopG family [Solirubrobacterales bacterium]
MRTTVTLDPDIDARLRALARERGVPLRVVLNDALRAGIRMGGRGEDTSYVLPSRRLGARAGIDLDKALALAGEQEDEEIGRKLDLRK